MFPTAVLISFAVSIALNVILPTSDVYSDLGTTVTTLNFDGPGIQLEGCRSCYFKTDDIVYGSPKGPCQTCIPRNYQLSCGANSLVLKKLRELQQTGSCSSEGWRSGGIAGNANLSNLEAYRFSNGTCTKNDKCCIHSTNETNIASPFPDISKKILVERLFTIFQISIAEGGVTFSPVYEENKDLFPPILYDDNNYPIYDANNDVQYLTAEDYADEYSIYVLSGNVGLNDCKGLFGTREEYENQIATFLRKTIPYKAAILFHNLTQHMFHNHTLDGGNVTFQEGFQFHDGCGILVLPKEESDRQMKESNEPRNNGEACGNDVCLTHLQYLKQISKTPIHDLETWRRTTFHGIEGIKFGGKICGVLQLYGWISLIPTLIHLLFNIVHYRLDYKKGEADLFDVIPLLCFIYPQWKSLKILFNYIEHRNEQRLEKEKNDFDRDLGALEPFLESTFQVNIALAILFTDQTLFPRNDYGVLIPFYRTFKEAIVKLSVFTSLVTASLGMAKFILNGPITILPKSFPINGLISPHFTAALFIHTMFGFRTLCLESALFTHYSKDSFNNVSKEYDTIKIEPILPTEYRMLVYFIPCVIPIMVSFVKILYTTKGLRGLGLAMYPQFIIGCGFSPIMYESYKVPEKGKYGIKIWKLGTIINAIYLGCAPQLLLLYMDHRRGVPSWEFSSKSVNQQKLDNDFEGNDSIFKHRLGGTLFAVISLVFFLILNISFFYWYFCRVEPETSHTFVTGASDVAELRKDKPSTENGTDNNDKDGETKDTVKKHQTNEREVAEEKAASSEEPKNNGIRKSFYSNMDTFWENANAKPGHHSTKKVDNDGT